jgi:hypothetical protein
MDSFILVTGVGEAAGEVGGAVGVVEAEGLENE